jgi:hypothetical protein
MITKLTVKKLYAQPVDVRLYNGNFNIARICVDNNKKRYELRYELSHPMLERFSGKRDKAEFIVWEGNTGLHSKIPDELLSLVAQMKEAAKMTYGQVVEAYRANDEALREFQRNFYQGYE